LQADVPENVNIIIQTGGSKSWKIAGISENNTDRYKIDNKRLILVDRIAEKQNFGESATLTSFISYGLANYPAAHTSLILWDHGGGSVDGVCLDENYNFDSLTLTELSTALKDANLTAKFDFIGFDACLMATYETATAIAPYANYMVASQEKEPSGGWDYGALVKSIGTETFYSDLLSSYAAKSADKDYYTLSCFDLNGLGDVDDMFSALIDEMSKNGKRTVVNAFNDAATFGLKGSGLFDLGNLFDYYDVAGDYLSHVTKVTSEMKHEATGLSIYFPLYDVSGAESYYDICQNEKYKTFLTDFNSDDGTGINFETYAEEIDNKLAFTLTYNSMANFAEVDYILISLDSDSEQASPIPYLLGNDNDAQVSGNKITIAFEGRWVQFGGQLLSCTIVDDIDGKTYYQAPVKVNGEVAQLLFEFDREKRVSDIIGVTYATDNYGRIYNLVAGDKIVVGTRLCDQSVYTTIYSDEKVFSYSGQDIEIVSLPDGYYQYTAFVRDVYGNVYTAGTAQVYVTSGDTKIQLITTDEVQYPPLG
jgi:hypothetical protein